MAKNQIKRGRGGKRAGAGRKPTGARRLTRVLQEEARLTKESAREVTRQLVFERLRPMVTAQMAHAEGISYMILRHPTGTFTRATDVAQLDAACAAGAAAFRIFTQAPNVQAFSDLMNRALDKPVEQVQVTGKDGGPVELAKQSDADLCALAEALLAKMRRS